MRVCNFLSILLVVMQFLNCGYINNPFKEKPDNSFAYTMFIVNYFIPSEEIRKQCAQPNAIYWGTTNAMFVNGGCINTKVDSGLIFDVETNQNITTDTLVSGKSFKCLCNGKVADFFYWGRSQQLFDTIPRPPPPMEAYFIYSKGSSTFSNDKDYSLTKFTYKANDNLFCITKCDINLSSTQYQYQFLKIRSSQ